MAHQYSSKFERVGRFIGRHAIAVILAWVVVGIAVNAAWPQLERVANEHSVSPLPSPSVSPSLKAMKTMSAAFGQKNADNAVVIAMASDDGFDREAQSLYSALVGRLRDDQQNVAYVQDILSNPDVRNNPIARDQVMSSDGKAWLLTATLQGGIGSPTAARASRQVNNLVEQTFRGTPVVAKVTGASSTVTDMAAIGASDLIKIGIITVIVIAIILLIVFRVSTTALLPVLVMGMSVLVARGVVAGLADAGVIPISSISGALMMAVLMGASVNYTVFLISRYHENIRRGEDPAEALAHACGSMTRVILATAATVAIANLAQLTAKLKFLAASGPCVAIAIVVGFLVVTTLLPAILSVAARFGLCMPGHDRAGPYWHRMGVLVVRHPARVFAFSLVLLVALATGTFFLKPSYDMQDQLPAKAPSNAAISLLNKHFPGNRMMPQFVLVQSKTDLRTPQGLADLDQMAGRIAQLPGVDKVVGITRPDGNKLTQATLAWQIGFLGDQMGRLGRDASDQLGPQMDRLTRIAD
ncbi:MMPL family transporter, partial [Jongsikchunia kroppenstedtii]|uniref:MMPL family transporter n=1 Tax=Jongsikchunia kroppenstedtii TaxID=1121721 RepID=UPI003F84B7F0